MTVGILTALGLGEKLEGAGAHGAATDCFLDAYCESGDLNALHAAADSYRRAGRRDDAFAELRRGFERAKLSGNETHMDQIMRHEAALLGDAGDAIKALELLKVVKTRQDERFAVTDNKSEYYEAAYTLGLMGHIALQVDNYWLHSLAAGYFHEALHRLQDGGHVEYELQVTLWWLRHPFLRREPKRRKNDLRHAFKLATFHVRSVPKTIEVVNLMLN